LVGRLLDTVDKLGFAENTIVIYTTDNGPMVCLYPDSATTPFRGEKNTNWDGGWRVPALIRWPGVVKPGTLFTDIVAGEDWLPTLVAAAGDPGVTDRLLKGETIGDRTYKVHLDGYNQMDYLAGKAPGVRNDFFYFSDDGDLLAVRYQSLKVHFMIQEATGIDVWRHPFTTLRAPIFFDLAIDPCERGQEGINYNDWWYRRTFLALPMKDIVGKMLMTFREFPPRQKPASFTIDQALMGLQKSAPPTN
jgi:arylsulfatase